jgi:uncharacterized protein (DUF58 family)
VLTSFKQTFNRWLFRPKIEQGTIILTQRRIFILPTRQGLVLAAVLILMLLGDINYNLSLGYILTFLLAMMALMSMLHAWRNLAHLEIRAGHTEPVYCGEAARFLLHFSSGLPRYQLALQSNSGSKITFDLPEKQTSEIFFPVPTSQRGWLTPGRLTLHTEFPLGLFHAWAYLHFDTRCLVYPKPLNAAPLPSGADGNLKHAGDDDFAGLRTYVPGDAQPRIAWKAYARGQGLLVKQFASQSGGELVLDIADAPEPDLEGKLSRMTRWVLDAEHQGLRYGLRLADEALPAGSGTAHRDVCLRRIALFGLQQDAPRPLVGEGLGRGH